MGDKTTAAGGGLTGLVLAGGVVLWAMGDFGSSGPVNPDELPITVSTDWRAVADWPGFEAEGASEPDPERLTTVIVFDDSGSMENEIEDAKTAVRQAIGSLPASGRVAVLGLNSGVILGSMPVAAAQQAIDRAITPVQADGGTPLGVRLGDAFRMLEAEAASQRGFGTYRVIVTTDGAASDEDVLRDTVVQVLSTSPVEIATIGLGIGEGHPLNLPGLTSYVAVDSVDRLADALQAAAAEQTVFEPITAFEGSN